MVSYGSILALFLFLVLILFDYIKRRVFFFAVFFLVWLYEKKKFRVTDSHYHSLELGGWKNLVNHLANRVCIGGVALSVFRLKIHFFRRTYVFIDCINKQNVIGDIAFSRCASCK